MHHVKVILRSLLNMSYQEIYILFVNEDDDVPSTSSQQTIKQIEAIREVISSEAYMMNESVINPKKQGDQI